jgi:hypothetical protein
MRANYPRGAKRRPTEGRNKARLHKWDKEAGMNTIMTFDEYSHMRESLRADRIPLAFYTSSSAVALSNSEIHLRQAVRSALGQIDRQRADNRDEASRGADNSISRRELLNQIARERVRRDGLATIEFLPMIDVAESNGETQISSGVDRWRFSADGTTLFNGQPDPSLAQIPAAQRIKAIRALVVTWQHPTVPADIASQVIAAGSASHGQYVILDDRFAYNAGDGNWIEGEQIAAIDPDKTVLETIQDAALAHSRHTVGADQLDPTIDDGITTVIGKEAILAEERAIEHHRVTRLREHISDIVLRAADASRHPYEDAASYAQQANSGTIHFGALAGTRQDVMRRVELEPNRYINLPVTEIHVANGDVYTLSENDSRSGIAVTPRGGQPRALIRGKFSPDDIDRLVTNTIRNDYGLPPDANVQTAIVGNALHGQYLVLINGAVRYRAANEEGWQLLPAELGITPQQLAGRHARTAMGLPAEPPAIAVNPGQTTRDAVRRMMGAATQATIAFADGENGSSAIAAAAFLQTVEGQKTLTRGVADARSLQRRRGGDGENIVTTVSGIMPDRTTIPASGARGATPDAEMPWYGRETVRITTTIRDDGSVAIGFSAISPRQALLDLADAAGKIAVAETNGEGITFAVASATLAQYRELLAENAANADDYLKIRSDLIQSWNASDRFSVSYDDARAIDPTASDIALRADTPDGDQLTPMIISVGNDSIDANGANRIYNPEGFTRWRANAAELNSARLASVTNIASFAHETGESAGDSDRRDNERAGTRRIITSRAFQNLDDETRWSHGFVEIGPNLWPFNKIPAPEYRLSTHEQRRQLVRSLQEAASRDPDFKERLAGHAMDVIVTDDKLLGRAFDYAANQAANRHFRAFNESTLPPVALNLTKGILSDIQINTHAPAAERRAQAESQFRAKAAADPAYALMLTQYASRRLTVPDDAYIPVVQALKTVAGGIALDDHTRSPSSFGEPQRALLAPYEIRRVLEGTDANFFLVTYDGIRPTRSPGFDAKPAVFTMEAAIASRQEIEGVLERSRGRQIAISSSREGTPHLVSADEDDRRRRMQILGAEMFAPMVAKTLKAHAGVQSFDIAIDTESGKAVLTPANAPRPSRTLHIATATRELIESAVNRAGLTGLPILATKDGDLHTAPDPMHARRVRATAMGMAFANALMDQDPRMLAEAR